MSWAAGRGLAIPNLNYGHRINKHFVAQDNLLIYVYTHTYYVMILGTGILSQRK